MIHCFGVCISLRLKLAPQGEQMCNFNAGGASADLGVFVFMGNVYIKAHIPSDISLP
jgi:hypothetical protein